jgi:crotonobetaine/carnitine-CoA ligase
MPSLREQDDGFVPMLRHRAGSDPDRVFARFMGEPITFAELDSQSDTLAAWLRRQGITRGDRIALMLRNCPTAIALLFAIAKLGAVWVPVNVQSRGDNLAFVLSHAAPRMIVADPDIVAVIQGCGAALVPIYTLGKGLPPAGTAGDLASALAAPEALCAPPPGAGDLFAIMYTSGTTGEPKGVLVTQCMLWYSAESIALMSDAQPGEVFHMWEPLYHIGGAQMILMPLIREVSLAMVQRFSASTFWREVHDYGASHIHYLGGILQILLKQPPGPLDQAHGARVGFGGGCPAHVWRDFEARFGIEIREAYGMTETSSVSAFNRGGPVGSVGKPVPWHRMEVLGPDGSPVPADTRGEIVVSAIEPGSITEGYYNNPEATAKALRNGRLHTGDLGSFDAEGNLFFHGRMTDSARVRGQNVSAWEVEHVAALHSSVEDCAMIAVPAEIGEHEIALFVQPKSGTGIDLPELSRWLEARLAEYQTPRYLTLVETFERTPSQRIMKHRLPRDLAGSWDRKAEASA